MTEKQNRKHMYKRLVFLTIFASLIVGGTWAINLLKEQSENTAAAPVKTDFNGKAVRLNLRKSMCLFQQHTGDKQKNEPEKITNNWKDQDPAKVLFLARQDMENGDFLLAEDRLRTALVFHGRNAKLYALLGKVLYFQEKYKEAEVFFRQQVYLAPDDPVSMNNLSAALAKQKRYHEAIATLQQLLKSDPDSASAVFNLAGMYAKSGDRKNALFYFRKAYKLLGHRILFLSQDKNFHSIRQTPEFISILEEAKRDFQKAKKADSLSPEKIKTGGIK